MIFIKLFITLIIWAAETLVATGIWNTIIVSLFAAPALNMLEMFCIYVLCKILFSDGGIEVITSEEK